MYKNNAATNSRGTHMTKTRHASYSSIVAAIFALLLVAGPALAQKWVTGAPIPQGAEEVYGIVAGGRRRTHRRDGRLTRPGSAKGETADGEGDQLAHGDPGQK